MIGCTVLAYPVCDSIVSQKHIFNVMRVHDIDNIDNDSHNKRDHCQDQHYYYFFCFFPRPYSCSTPFPGSIPQFLCSCFSVVASFQGSCTVNHGVFRCKPTFSQGVLVWSSSFFLLGFPASYANRICLARRESAWKAQDTRHKRQICGFLATK